MKSTALPSLSEEQLPVELLKILKQSSEKRILLEIKNKRIYYSIPKSINKVRDRYSELIDKKYFKGLSKEEKDELTELEAILDETEEPIYNPIKQILNKELSMLKKKSI